MRRQTKGNNVVQLHTVITAANHTVSWQPKKKLVYIQASKDSDWTGGI